MKIQGQSQLQFSCENVIMMCDSALAAIDAYIPVMMEREIVRRMNQWTTSTGLFKPRRNLTRDEADATMDAEDGWNGAERKWIMRSYDKEKEFLGRLKSKADVQGQLTGFDSMITITVEDANYFYVGGVNHMLGVQP